MRENREAWNQKTDVSAWTRQQEICSTVARCLTDCTDIRLKLCWKIKKFINSLQSFEERYTGMLCKYGLLLSESQVCFSKTDTVLHCVFICTYVKIDNLFSFFSYRIYLFLIHYWRILYIALVIRKITLTLHWNINFQGELTFSTFWR